MNFFIKRYNRYLKKHAQAFFLIKIENISLKEKYQNTQGGQSKNPLIT